MRKRGTDAPTCEDLGRAGLYQLGLSYAVDDVVLVAIQALEEARAPWWQRRGFWPGVLVGAALVTGALAVVLVLA